jgi:hypothetical protein
MTSPVLPQESDDNYYEVIGANDGRTNESMDQFIASLEESFEYPQLATLASGQTDEEIAAEILGDEGQEIPDDEEIEDEEVVTPPAPVPVAEVPPVPPAPVVTSPETVTINGQQILTSDVQRLYEFDQFLRSNPEAAQRVKAAVEPVVPAPAVEATPTPDPALTPPEWMDLEDPAQRFMWESHVTNQKTLSALQAQSMQRQQSEINAQAAANTNTAISQWVAAHPNFNEDQVNEVRKHAAQMNLIDSLIATSPNPIVAVSRALDLAAMDKPELRTVYLDTEAPPTPTRQQASRTRKSKLNALGGSSGSVPRTTTTPKAMSDREAIDQFAAGLAESFQNN